MNLIHVDFEGELELYEINCPLLQLSFDLRLMTADS